MVQAMESGSNIGLVKSIEYKRVGLGGGAGRGGDERLIWGVTIKELRGSEK